MWFPETFIGFNFDRRFNSRVSTSDAQYGFQRCRSTQDAVTLFLFLYIQILKTNEFLPRIRCQVRARLEVKDEHKLITAKSYGPWKISSFMLHRFLDISLCTPTEAECSKQSFKFFDDA